MGKVRRVGIFGVGHVGAHVANALMLRGLVDELLLSDTNEGKLASWHRSCTHIRENIARLDWWNE